MMLSSLSSLSLPSLSRSLHGILALTISATCIIASPANAVAADKQPISALPLLPAPPKDAAAPTDPKKMGVTGLTVKEAPGYGATTVVEARALTGRGYCLVSREYGLRLESTSSSSPYDDELWRFTESADGKASLERTRVQVLTPEPTAYVTSKTSIALVRVSQSNGVSVWGLRETNGDIVLIARGGDTGREARLPKTAEDGSVQFVSSDCTWGATRINTSFSKRGAVAQLRGSLPPVGEGKQKVTPHFVVNGSLSKVSRDPEPVLAVTVTLTTD